MASSYTMDPTVASAVTTLASFMVGLLTAFLTQVIQDKRATSRERAKVENGAKEALATAVASEILTNSKAIEAFLRSPANPPTLKVADFNIVFAAHKAAFGFLESPKLDAYRQQLNELYRTTIPRYEDAVEGWQAASPADKPKAWTAVLDAAADIKTRLSRF